MDFSWDAIGRRMRLVRLALGITEQEAAAAWQVTLRTYRKWETGARQHSSTWNVVCFAEKYDVSIDWLIAGDTASLGRHLTEGKIAILPSAGPQWRRHQGGIVS
jgi:transcriptional regulator with XRE-family HTH domain